MSRVGIEHTIPAFEWVKTVHAIDGAATGIGAAWRLGNEVKKNGKGGRYGARGEGYRLHITLQSENVEVWVNFADLGLDMEVVLK
jgi:hypothetical protein